MLTWVRFVAAVVLFAGCLPTLGWAETPAAPAAEPAGENENLVRLSKEHEVWIDKKLKQVIVTGEVSLREGRLEMFACPKGTKEHESIVAVNSSGKLLHAALLAAGAVPGRTMQWEPKYIPASGTVIDVFVEWSDDKGMHREKAQDWVKDLASGKPMTHSWVFAGSGFWVHEQTGEKFYHADSGDLICVSNFSTAMLDLPIGSSAANDRLAFAPLTERIPARGTKVKIILAPRLEAPKPAAEAPK